MCRTDDRKRKISFCDSICGMYLLFFDWFYRNNSKLDDKKVDCPFCKKEVLKAELKAHLIRNHSMRCPMENQLKGQFQCPICLEDVTQSDAKAPQCGHVMHATCEEKLPKKLIRGKSCIKCPICRKSSCTIKLY